MFLSVADPDLELRKGGGGGLDLLSFIFIPIHFHLAPVEGLFFKPKYRANILCICFNFIAVLFLFLSSPWGSVYRFCTVSFDSN